MSMKRFAFLSALLTTALSPAIAGAQQPPTFATGMIPGNHILLPDGEPRAAVFLISDASGWGQAEEDEAKALVDKGAAVVGIDFPTYLDALKADKGDCVYMVSDVESVSHQVQRAGGATRYSPPIVAGIGEGGALALAMISQSPVSTLGEAIAADPLSGIPLKKVLCTPAQKTVTGERTVYGFTDGALPAAATVLLTKDADTAGREHAAALKASHDDLDVVDADGPALTALSKALADRVDASGSEDDPLGLPLTILEAKPVMDTMAVVLSGDGGWRDIDAQVANVLQQKGIPVAGLDSLHYFWSERKPQEVADDLERIIDIYRRKWNVSHVLLVGYSFGADVLPATYNLLKPETRRRIPQISLMALSHEVDYEISVSGWLGVKGTGAGGDPVNDIAKIDPKLLQCIYGTEEDDDPCPTLKDRGVQSIPIVGGHHFDEDYEGLTGRIIEGLRGRLEKG